MKITKYITGFFIIITLFSAGFAHAKENILPKSRPSDLKKIEKKSIKKEILLPKKKPGQKKSVEKKEIVKTTDVTTEIIILPQKKPLIFKIPKTKKSQVVKSKVFSKNDFKLAKKSFEAIKKKKWQTAIKLSSKAKDKDLHNLVLWMYLKQSGNQATFFDYAGFINANPDFPRIERLRYLAEHKINLKNITASRLIKWFGSREPHSGYGKLMLGESLISTGQNAEGINLIKEGWVSAKLSRADMKYLRKKYKKYLNKEDYIKRADYLAWENKHWDLKRMLRYLPKDYQALYTARQLLMSKSYGVDDAIAKVPSHLKNEIGLKYDRLKWRRKRGRTESSIEILQNIPRDPKKLVRPEKWWKERAIITRSLIYKNKYPLAYKISSSHSMFEGPEYAEAEWLSGWLALAFLEDPGLALQHFQNFFNNVGYPISLSRGAYWIARTYEKLKNEKLARKWYKEASKYKTTYYGQLAFIKIYPDDFFALEESSIKIKQEYEKKFNKNRLVKLAILLKELDKIKYAKDIIKHLAKDNVEDGSEIIAGKFAASLGKYDFAIQIAKQASYEKRFLNEINYPIINTPEYVNNKRMANQELVLAVIRQESEFDPKAHSYAGARGMMQLMTYTAKLVAKQSKLPYSKSKLKSDPNYNIQLGSYYLSGLLEEYEGSYPFALAAYNAGPKRVRYWRKINGDPRKRQIDYVNWIELIKFKETRNYVQRVLENVNVYKFMISKNPIKIHNFFEDKPHY
tara:strand:- start:1044 stop:3266 length:2223 start_codon:yes stop_codon:yes gene_type:complete